MSASINPTAAPARANESATLTATVDFPTPPLPEPIATVLETSGMSPAGASMLRRTFAPILRSTEATPGTVASAARTSVSIWVLSGHPGVVKLTVNDATPPSTLRPSIIPRVTMSTCSSGSLTCFSASRTRASSVVFTLTSFPSWRRRRPPGGRKAAQVADHLAAREHQDAERAAHPIGKDQVLERLALLQIGPREELERPERQEEFHLPRGADASQARAFRGAGDRREVDVR